MKTTDGDEVAVVRRTDLVHDGGKYVDVPIASLRLTLIEGGHSTNDPEGWAVAILTPAEARELAADLTRLADEIEGVPSLATVAARALEAWANGAGFLPEQEARQELRGVLARSFPQESEV